MARLIQAVLGSVSCVLLCLIGRKIFDGRSGFIAGLLMAFYPLFIYFDGELLIPVLLVFLLLGGFLFFCHRDEKWFYLPLAGLFFGLGAIARPNVLLFVFVLPIWFFFQNRKGWLRRSAIFLGAAFVPILPVTARNYVKSKSFVLIAWQAGTNFYIGNNEYSDGTTAIVPGTRGTWWGGYNDVKRIAESEAGRQLRGYEIDRFWLKKGLEFWRRSPLKALYLTLRKFYLWFSGYEVSNNRDKYFFKRYTLLNFLWFNTPFFKFPFGVLFPLALAGIYLTRKKWRRLMPVYLFLFSYMLSFVFFFITARYRLPVLPFYFLFAVQAVRLFAQQEKKERKIALLITISSFVIFNLDLFGTGRQTDPAQNHFTAAMGYYSQGKFTLAQKEIDRALLLDSATNILSLKATMLLEQNRIDEAKQIAEAAVRLHPDEADSYGIAGNVFASANELNRAEVMFQRAVELDPYGVEAWNNLGNINLSKRDLAQARRCYEQALKVSPTFTMALFHLGLVYYYEGKTDSAHYLWQKVLSLDPDFDKARQALRELR
ncbi:MAG: tetratricopeptide repeat protein [candidate division WOR-3 bacterium]